MTPRGPQVLDGDGNCGSGTRQSCEETIRIGTVKTKTFANTGALERTFFVADSFASAE